MRPTTKIKRALACLTAGAAMAFAAPALGAQDPVEKGSMKLKLSSRFADSLSSAGVKMTPTSFTIDGGSVDPTDGSATLSLKGRMRFRTAIRKLVFRKVNARLGGVGVLKVGGVRMFRLQGGKVQRNGFGAEVSGVKATLTSKGAEKLKRRLRVSGISRMRAGKISLSEQPHTVEVTGGTVRLVPNPTRTYGAGTLASKLQSHCIDFINGNTAIPPAVKVENDPDPGAPYYTFPVSGGTIGPDAGAGRVELDGGLKITNTNSSYGSCNSSSPPLATLMQTELAYKLGAKSISSRVMISGATPDEAGDQGIADGSSLDLGAATLSADPSPGRITIKGIEIRQKKGAALLLNQVFPQRTGHYDGAQEFTTGDLFGVADMTVTTR